MATAARRRNSWATSGVVKTPGIPAPTGRYNVGCIDIMAESGLLVRLYYPTHVQENQGYQYASAIPDSQYVKSSCEIYKTRPAWLFTALLTTLTDARIPALLHAPLYNLKGVANGDTPPEENFPVVVFSHGLHAHRVIYSGICCDVCSHGYVVAAVEHKDKSACVTFNRVPGVGVAEGDYDKYVNEWVPVLVRPTTGADIFPFRNEQLQQRGGEVSKTLDLLHSLNGGEEVKNLMGGTFDLHQFAGRLDTDKAAVMGHSFGGATTVVTLATDNRFRCGIPLDVWMFPISDDVYNGGINQPLLFINSFSFQWAENVASIMRLTTPPDESGIVRCSVVTLKGTSHFTQCDVGFILPSLINKEYWVPNMYEANGANSELIIAFFKRHLLKDPAYQGRVPLLDGGEGSNDLVLYGTNVDWKQKAEQNTVTTAVNEEGENTATTTGNEGENTATTTANEGENTATTTANEGENTATTTANEGENTATTTANEGENTATTTTNEGENTATTTANEGENTATTTANEGQNTANEGENTATTTANEGENTANEGENTATTTANEGENTANHAEEGITEVKDTNNVSEQV